MPSPIAGETAVDEREPSKQLGSKEMSPEEGSTISPPAGLIAGRDDGQPRVTSPPSGSKFVHDQQMPVAHDDFTDTESIKVKNRSDEGSSSDEEEEAMDEDDEQLQEKPDASENKMNIQLLEGGGGGDDSCWSTSDVENFDGKIVYNPDGSAYIIEDSELSDEDAVELPQLIGDGCIVDGRGVNATRNEGFPPIANAIYVSRNQALYHPPYSNFVHFSKSGAVDKNIVNDVPVMHSYRVYSLRDNKGERDRIGNQSHESTSSGKDCSSVPVKPILMCFICKLSFGFAKSFVAHAMSDHNVMLQDEEKDILSHKNTSAIIQCVGKEKEPLVSFLEPLSPPIVAPSLDGKYRPSVGQSSFSSAFGENNTQKVPNNNSNNSNKSNNNSPVKNFADGNGSSDFNDQHVPETTVSLPGSGSSRNNSNLVGSSSNSGNNNNGGSTNSGASSPNVMNNTSSNSNNGRGLMNCIMDLTRKSPISVSSSGANNNNSVTMTSPGASLSPGSTTPVGSLLPTAASPSALNFSPHQHPPPNFLTGTTIGVCPDHMGGRPSGIDCSKCELILSSSRLNVGGGPLAGMHSRNSCKTLKCPKCNWHYKYQETLEIHMKEKHPETETSCLYCIAGQPHPRLARGETYTCGYKPYRCEVCNYSTTTKGNLSIHMQSDKHLNNMQELQNGTVSNSELSTHQPSATPLSQPHNKPTGMSSPGSGSSSMTPYHSHSPMSSSGQTPKPKPTFRCDVCNYETNVARNLRIHMTSEKHTHNILVLQQNMKQMQALSAIQQSQQHQQQFNLEQLLHFHTLPGEKPPPHSEAALADMAYNQALLIQLITGGQLPPHMTPELSPNLDMGLNPETMEPPPEPADPNPENLYQCCVCNIFTTDSLEALSHHLAADRTKIREQEILAIVAGHYVCKLCTYKTTLKANFQLHCKTDKHLQRLQHVNHVKEGGARNEWKLKYVSSPGGVQVRCNACDYYTNSTHKLQLHSAAQRHEFSASLFRHLRDYYDDTNKIYQCVLCEFSCTDKLPLFQHVRSMKHLQIEQIHQLQRRSAGKDGQLEFNEMFKIIPSCPDASEQDHKSNVQDRHNSSGEPKDLSESMNSSFTSDPGQDAEDDDEGQASANEHETNNTCSFCTFTCSSEMRMQAHILAQHTHSRESSPQRQSHSAPSMTSPEKMLSCPLCQDKFSDKVTLEKHVMQIHSVNSEGLQTLLMLVDRSHWLNNASKPNSQTTPPSQRHSPSSSTASSGGKDMETRCAQSDSSKADTEEGEESADHLEDSIQRNHVNNLGAVSERHVYKYRCSQCSLAFKTMEKLQVHSQYHFIRDATKCVLCSRNFRSIIALQKHVETAHAEVTEEEQAIFKQSLVNNPLLLAGLSGQVLDGPTTELLKRENFRDVDESMEEESSISLTHHSKKDKKVPHRKGEKVIYPMEKYLDPNRPYKCEVCKESFTQKNILLVHFNSVSHLHKLKRSNKEIQNNAGISLVSPNINKAGTDPIDLKKLPQDLCCSPIKSSTLPSTSPVNDCAQNSQGSQISPLTNSIDGVAANAMSSVVSSTPQSHHGVFSCPRCTAAFVSQEQLQTHQQLYCMFNSSMSMLPGLTGVSPAAFPQLSDGKISSLSDEAFMKFTPQAKKSSHMYKHLLESFGFDLVMQFNENHERRQRKEREENERLLAELHQSTQMVSDEKLAVEEKKDDTVTDEKEEILSLPEVSKSTCAHCNKEFSSVWVLKAHCEEVHKDLVPLDFLEKYAQQIKCEIEKKVVPGSVSSNATSHESKTNKESVNTINSTQSSSVTTTADVGTDVYASHREDRDNGDENEGRALNMSSNAANATDNSMYDSEKENDDINKELAKVCSSAPHRDSMVTPNPRTACSTPASSTESIPATTGNVNPSPNLPMALAQQMSDMQAAINAMAATQLQQQLQFNPMMMGMAGLGMGLPLGLNMNALAAMNLQPPLVPMMMPPPSFDPLGVTQNALFPQQTSNLDATSILTKQQQHLLQQQQQVASASQQKRARTRITDDQLKILRAHFDINNSPSEEQINKMAAESGLPPKVIKHWFRNTLFKERQRNKDSPYNFNNPPSTTLNLEEYEKTGEAKVMPLSSSNPDESIQSLHSSDFSPVKSGNNSVNMYSTETESPIKKEEYEDVKPNIYSSPAALKTSAALSLLTSEAESRIKKEEYDDIKPNVQHLHERETSSPASPNISERVGSVPTPCSSPEDLTVPSVFNSQHLSSELTSTPSPIANTSVHSGNNMLPPPKLNPNFNTPNQSLSNSNFATSVMNRCLSPGRSSTADCYTPNMLSSGNSNSSNSSGGSTGKRANRTRFTDYQIKVLQEFFENNAYPKDDDLEYLSKLLSLSPRVIVVWFQNARQKARKVYENQPPVEPVTGVDENASRFQRTPGLNYQCKKCTLVFQRYYELIRHQKTHCFKEEDAKRSAQAQAAAAQMAAVLSSEDSNSSTIVEQNQQCNVTNSNPSTPAPPVTPTLSSTAYPPSPGASNHPSTPEPKETLQCESCNLVFPRIELWREHQLIHMMNPNLFPNYPPESPFGILQQQAQQQQQQSQQSQILSQQSSQLLAHESFSTNSNSATEMTSNSNPTSPHPLLAMFSSNKRKYEEYVYLDRDGDQPKDKRLRTTILPEQLDYLYQKYQIESNPSRKMLENIANEVGLKKRVVQVWFQNTRARERKGQFRAHSQVINKRCPFCPALFKVKTALESHLSTKHTDQCSRGEINIDALPDEETSMDSESFLTPSLQAGGSDTNSKFPANAMMHPHFQSVLHAAAAAAAAGSEMDRKRCYEDSLRQYLLELQPHQNILNGGLEKDNNSNAFSSSKSNNGDRDQDAPEGTGESPLDLSKHLEGRMGAIDTDTDEFDERATSIHNNNNNEPSQQQQQLMAQLQMLQMAGIGMQSAQQMMAIAAGKLDGKSMGQLNPEEMGLLQQFYGFGLAAGGLPQKLFQSPTGSVDDSY